MKCNLCKIITFRVKLDNKLISLAQRHSEYKDKSLLNFFVKFRNMRTRKTDQITNIFTFGRVTKRFSQKPLSLSESLLSTIEPIEHQVYQPSSLLTIEPIDHQAKPKTKTPIIRGGVHFTGRIPFSKHPF